MGANPTVIHKFYDQLQAEIEHLNTTNPQHIWNCDESGCKDVPDELSVVGETGVPVVNIVGKEQGEISTTLTFANAQGQCLPPMVIHKGGKVRDTWLKDKPPGIMLRTSPTGWINKDLFLEYATRWVRWLKGWKLLNKPHILLLDSHKSHVYNIRFLELMKEFNITVLAIPAHTSHCTQPLDKTPFASLKREWNENLLAYLFDHVGCRLPKMDFFFCFLASLAKIHDQTECPVRVQKNRYIPL